MSKAAWSAAWSGALAVFGIVLNGVALGFYRLEVVPALLGETALLLAMWLWYSGGASQRRPPAETRAPISSRRALDQAQYAALICDYRFRTETHFKLLPDGLRNGFCKQCGALGLEGSTTHPIWDGPFDDGGSGKVDVLHFVWCAKCDGPPPDPVGAPIRLPYLDHLPIRLLPELYARPAFHQLVMPVELYVAPKVPDDPGFPSIEASSKPHRFYPYKFADGSETCRACGLGPENRLHAPLTPHPTSAEVTDCPGCKTIGEPHRSPSSEHPHGLAGLMEDR